MFLLLLLLLLLLFLEVEGLEKKELVEYAKEANLDCAGRGSPVCVVDLLSIFPFRKGFGLDWWG